MTTKKKRSRKISNILKSKEPAKKLTSFNSWFFQKAEVEKKVRVSQKREIYVFFKNNGLSDLEDPDKYEELLKKY